MEPENTNFHVAGWICFACCVIGLFQTFLAHDGFSDPKVNVGGHYLQKYVTGEEAIRISVERRNRAIFFFSLATAAGAAAIFFKVKEVRGAYVEQETRW